MCGHRNLRLGFAPYITLIGSRGMRLTELATVLGISRQACNQAANQVEDAGYIMRKSDPLGRPGQTTGTDSAGYAAARGWQAHRCQD